MNRVSFYFLLSVICLSGIGDTAAAELDQAFLDEAIQLIKSDKFDQAEALAKKTQQSKEASIEALTILAQCRIWQDDPIQAIAYLNQALKASRDDAFNAYYRVSTALLPKLYQQKDLDEVDQNYFKFYLGELNGKLEQNSQDVEILIYRSDMIDNMELASGFDNKIQPLSVRYDFAICDVTMALGAASEKELWTCYHSRAHLWNMRADLGDQFCFQQQVNDLRQMLLYSSDPEDEMPKLGEALLNAGKYQEVMELIPEQMDHLTSSTVGQWLSIKADCLMARKQFQEAILAYSRLIIHRKKESKEEFLVSPLKQRADCYFELQQYERAIIDLDRSIELDQTATIPGFERLQHASQWSSKYRVMLRQGRWDEIQAAIDGEESASNFPHSARYHRACYFMELKRWEEAERDFNVLIKSKKSDDYDTYRNLAIVCRHLGKKDLAEQYAARAQKIYDSFDPWEKSYVDENAP